jgi:hypothetical protein
MNAPETIDPIRYGVLWQKVQDYERRFDEMSAKIDKLVELANQGRGSFYAGLVMVSAVGSVMGYLSHWIGKS